MADDEELPEGTPRDYVLTICRTLQRLALDLTVHFPDDADTARAQKRIIIAIKEFPIWIVDDVGKGIFKYRKQIYGRDTDFFLHSKFDAERAKAFRDDPDKGRLTDHLIPKVKEAWRQSDGRDQDRYIDQLTEILDAYIDYKLLKKAGR